MKKGVLIYRGPLQRSRLRLIILAYLEAFDSVDFIWLLPNKKYHNSKNNQFDEFISKFDLDTIEIRLATLSNIISCRKFLTKYSSSTIPISVGIIGTSAKFFVPSILVQNATWFINGIPEERLLFSSSFKDKIRIAVFWKSLQLFRVPKKIVTVSDNMGKYLSEYFPKSSFYTIPSTVPLYSVEIDMSKKYFLAYSGSGAPWQWISKLEEIWYNLYLLDSSLRFKVISRDKRMDLLRARIPESNLEFVSAKDSYEVFQHLKDCKVGFLIRQDHLINRVASPIKFGEYLGAGCLVVTSNLKWAISDFIEKRKCGLLVDVDMVKSDIAKNIHSYLSNVKLKDYELAIESASEFSLDRNVEKLVAYLN